MSQSTSRFRRILHKAAAAAAALSIGLGMSAAPAQALTINFNGSALDLSTEAITAGTAGDLEGAARALADFTGSFINDGTTLSVEDYAGQVKPFAKTTPVDENGNVQVVLFDPRLNGGAPIGNELTGKEALLEALPKPNDVGMTADGRSVRFPTKGNFTSGYGLRGNAIHEGIDIANAIGTPIRAVMDGVVTNTGPAEGYGNWVVIQHAGGERSIYGHMATINVSPGQQVKAGETIALMGNEGRSTGPHLHFEILPDGVHPVDPVPWFANQGISVHAARQ